MDNGEKMDKFKNLIKTRDDAYDRNTGEALQIISNFLMGAEAHLKDESAFPGKYNVLWMSCDIKKVNEDDFVNVAGILYLNNNVEKQMKSEDDLTNQVIRISVPLEVALLQNQEEVKTYLALVSTTGKIEQPSENQSPDFNYSQLSDDQRDRLFLTKTTDVLH